MATKKVKNETPPPKTQWEKDWDARVTPFCRAVGCTETEFVNALKGLVGDKNEEALSLLASEEFTPFADLADALKSLAIPLAKLRMHIPKLRAIIAQQSAKPISAGVGLPDLPDERSFLEALKTGGVLKIDKTAVMAALRVALAAKKGLFELPKTIVDKMEKVAETKDEPASEVFYEVHTLVATRRYSEVLAALGVKNFTRFVSESRKRTFIQKVLDVLLPELARFQDELSRWQQNWLAMSNTTGIAALAMMTSGGTTGMPAGMLQAPDTAPLCAKADVVINKINTVFSGFGLVISRALAYEAGQILDFLEKEELPYLVGAQNREMMFRELGVTVLSDHVRMEKGLAKFALGIMEFPQVVADAQASYAAQLYQLGMTLFPSSASTETVEATPKKPRRQPFFEEDET